MFKGKENGVRGEMEKMRVKKIKLIQSIVNKEEKGLDRRKREWK